MKEGGFQGLGEAPQSPFPGAGEKVIALDEISAGEFGALQALVKDVSGINLGEGKEALVKGRLAKRLRCLGLRSFADYIEFLRNDRSGEELSRMVDEITTNVTQFFREPDHFDYLRNVILPGLVEERIGSRRILRIWSAGCSSGEEPYSTAIHLCEGIQNLGSWDAKILATDLSTDVLEIARQGIYDASKVESLPRQLLHNYFQRLPGSREERRYQVSEDLRRLVHFARLNLMGAWPMQGPFDVIFCRNVMIYFDKETQGKLVARYHDLLSPGGILFIGHSESLVGISSGFKSIGPAAYQRS